ncbi:type I inositol polyphosphate 5-phosphatase 10-like [Macadamia integrifolia]|uniref:type I inositol polyphosphate 5-phosphatase 10-like n=1 Tax=Macadamia integrifolia TaxID=60698 RepID=UPI001C4FFF5D|nr:type I inositol polyphosphate 5-phosphatase 10-like [Macadamia integrifolia]XP_042513981.1 type I inositol polyphosphate 5-phosphatase 10-like [Macadamia integrifolia]
MTLGNDERKKFRLRKIFRTRENKGRKKREGPIDSSVEFERCSPFSATAIKKSLSESTSRLGSFKFRSPRSPMTNFPDFQTLRVFVATWNAGGKCPHSDLNLGDFLQVEDPSDIYVLGFQEIVPLNAGNVLVIEDNEPAAKWLALINQALNKTPDDNTTDIPSPPLDYCPFPSEASGKKPISKDLKPNGGRLFFQKPSLKKVSRSLKVQKGRSLKSCNCCPSDLERKNSKDSCFRCQEAYVAEDDSSSENEDGSNSFLMTEITTNQMNYSLIASKQMVGIFVTVWARKELVPHIGHLRLSCVGRGILGYLGNKGCISVSMSLHQTSFCFVCSHLASGEKEGDELRRNSDVIEILKSTQFRKICKAPHRRIPERILEHDRVIWLGDLNYRIALSYSETRKLLENNDWDALLAKDQLKIEREAGRVFEGWKEGKIYFPPTYKYSNNSDSYAGESVTSKKKRRTPAWCDRILWRGNGIEQLYYVRGESRFSDHRPVCAAFEVRVAILEGKNKKALSNSNMKVEIEELLPPTAARYLHRQCVVEKT